MKPLVIIITLLLLSGCKLESKEDEKAERLYSYDIEERLKELDIVLHEPKLPKGVNITLSVKSNNLVYLSGNGPIDITGNKVVGKVGKDISVEEAYKAARLTAINQLSVLKAHIGDLNKVEKIVKVFGMVNANPTFTEHPKVINGFSDVMIAVFGERGEHARSAVGMSSLPWNIACEIEMIVQVKN